MVKKKRKYTKKDKSEKTISHATTPLTGRQYVSTGYSTDLKNAFASDTDTIIEDDYFSEESEAAARESLEKEINRYHESDSTEVKVEEKKVCEYCTHIDSQLRKLYIGLGLASFGLLAISFWGRKTNLNPQVTGFFQGAFVVQIAFAIYLIIGYKELKQKSESA